MSLSLSRPTDQGLIDYCGIEPEYYDRVAHNTWDACRNYYAAHPYLHPNTPNTTFTPAPVNSGPQIPADVANEWIGSHMALLGIAGFALAAILVIITLLGRSRNV